MLKSAVKIGFIGALALMLGRAFYSLFILLATFIGAVALLACFFAWFYFATNSGWLVIG